MTELQPPPRGPRLPARDQAHFHKKKIVVVTIVGVLILLLVASLALATGLIVPG